MRSKEIMFRLLDLLHCLAVSSIGGCGGNGGNSGILVVGGCHEVVCHLRVKLGGSLLSRTGVATALLLGAFAGRLSSTLLVSSSRLWLCLRLRLWLSGALSKSFGGRDEPVRLGGANHDLNLDRAAVNQQAVQLLEGLASTLAITERDIGDAAAL
jgi:hypothetical protein